MGAKHYSTIVATGSCAGEKIIHNSYFVGKELYRENGSGKLELKSGKTAEEIYSVTGIGERRWTDRRPADLGAETLRQIIEAAKKKPELLIVAHNSKFSETLYSPIPAHSAIAQKKTNKPNTIAFDIVTDDGSIQLEDIVRAYSAGKFCSIYAAGIEDDGGPRHVECRPYPENPDIIIAEHSGFDSMAKRIKKQVGLRKADTLDVTAGCSGFTVALDVADRLIKQGKYKRIAVIGVDVLTDIRDEHHLDSTLFSDNAGGVLIEPSKEPGIKCSRFETYGSLGHYLRLDIGVQERLDAEKRGTAPSEKKGPFYLRMNGNEIFKFAVKQLPRFVNKLIGDAGIELSDVAAIFFHQMNGRILRSSVARLYSTQNDEEFSRVIEEKIPWSVDEYGNSSVATIPLALDLVLKGKLDRRCYDARTDRIVKKTNEPFELKLGSGKYIVTAAVGAGLVIGGNVIKL